jgi:hypothetical protein
MGRSARRSKEHRNDADDRADTDLDVVSDARTFTVTDKELGPP